MKKQQASGLDFEIDRLTNSIQNVLTGEVFDTEINRLTANNIKQIKRTGWLFDWHKELRDRTKEIYKLTTVNNPTIIQGLLVLKTNRTTFLCI